MNKVPDWLRRKRWLILEVIIVAILFFGLRAWQQRHLVSGVAPQITGQLLDGRVLDWQSYRGRPLLVHFWASWCPVCKLEQDSVQQLAKDYPVITLASWSGEGDEVAAYMQKNQLDFPVLVDAQGDWAERFGISGVPASFLLDAEGNIAFAEIGYTSEWGFRLRLWWLGI